MFTVWAQSTANEAFLSGSQKPKSSNSPSDWPCFRQPPTPSLQRTETNAATVNIELATSVTLSNTYYIYESHCFLVRMRWSLTLKLHPHRKQHNSTFRGISSLIMTASPILPLWSTVVLLAGVAQAAMAKCNYGNNLARCFAATPSLADSYCSSFLGVQDVTSTVTSTGSV